MKFFKFKSNHIKYEENYEFFHEKTIQFKKSEFYLKKIKRLFKKDSYTIIRLLIGILQFIFGILSTIYNYQNIVIQEQMRMRPGLSLVNLWKKPPVQIKFKIYLFNVTNSNEFLNGIDDHLKMDEIGPITCLESIEQKDIVYHDNSTMSFTTVRQIDFRPEDNQPGILNKTLIIPNFVLLAMATSLHDSSIFMKMAFNMVAKGDQAFIQRTVYQILWDNKIPSVEFIDNFLPFLIPQTNVGILTKKRMFNRFNVKIGSNVTKEDFFLINNFNGLNKIPAHKSEYRNCSVDITNAREGTGYPLFMTKNTSFNLWREELCRTYPFVFSEKVIKHSFHGYKFTLSNDMFRRFPNLEDDCFKGTYDQPLPDGVIDYTKCSLGLPSTFSNPHFYGFDGPWKKYLKGLNPSKENHSTYIIIEPNCGIPLEAALRTQYNTPVPNLRGFTKDIQRFSNKLIPLFWCECYVSEVIPLVGTLLKLFYWLPVVQPLLAVIFLFWGAYLSTTSLAKLKFTIKQQK